ncbi:hypothetical protein PT974_11351 [Cladobotryum mycophilum]|uniref:Pali-domain-containing protein n=1 Tax=Cladobotryum mycophilum TaxID=491253 RepID=A0ABR0S5W0_9HYPO
MGVGTAIHHVGTVLLLAATALLIVVSITSPVVNNLSLMKVDLNGQNTIGDRVTFGTFGYCILGVNGRDACTGSHIGYEPTNVISQIDNVSFSNADHDSTKILTKVFVLHPVAAGLSFLAFLLCLGTSIIGSFIASVFSLLAFVATIIALACDFATFAIIKHAVNTRSSTASEASWGTGVWCVVAAAACTLVASLLVFVTCCAGRRKSSRRNKDAAGY